MTFTSETTTAPMQVLPHHPLSADECKVIEAVIAAIVKSVEIDQENVATDDAIQSLAAIAVQLIRRGGEPPKAVSS